MKLTELEPDWVRADGPGKVGREIKTLSQAQGVFFLCPKCYRDNGGNVGTHAVICWFKGRGVPDSERPGPGRWEVSGTGFSDLTLRPSVHLTGEGCGWHGFVTNGEVTIL